MAGSQFSRIRSTERRRTSGSGAGTGCSSSSSTKYAWCSPVVPIISSVSPGRDTAGSNRSMIVSGSSISVPPHPVPGLATLKYRPGVDRRPLTLIPVARDIQVPARLVLGEHARDVIVDHDHLVDVLVPLLREHPDRRGPASHAHPFLDHPVDHRRLAGLEDQLRPFVHRELDRPTAAERQQRLHRHHAFALGAAREVVHPSQREHLRSVLPGGDVPDRLPVRRARSGVRRRHDGPCRSSRPRRSS